MKSTFARIVCRILVASMVVLPFQARAGLIGTGQAVSAAQAQAARVTVSNYLVRSDVAAQLVALGVSPQAASERVAALTDAEVAGLAGRIDEQPAGGVTGILFVLVVIVLFWHFVLREDKADVGKGSKPAPAPEKK